jgi:hypothetical protein
MSARISHVVDTPPSLKVPPLPDTEKDIQLWLTNRFKTDVPEVPFVPSVVVVVVVVVVVRA